MRQSHKTVLLWIILILMFVSIYHLFTNPGKGEEKQDFGQFVEEIKNPEKRAQIDKITIQPRGNNSAKYVILYKNSQKKTVTQGEYFDSTTELFRNNGVNYSVDLKEESTFWASILIQWLPMLFLFVIFIFFMRQLQAGGGKAMSFGKSKAKLLTDHQNKVTFKDVAGIEEAKDEVEEIIAFLKDPKKFTRLGGRIPKGVLMMGPPGTGKTLLARAIAGEAGVPFFSISGSDFVEMFVGVGASRVRDLFEQGKKNAPCIIFIDEIDAVGRHRGAGLGGGHDEREQTLNQLLVEMDGFESNDGVILIAATNRPDVLDPALLRPGRFDRRIVVPRPDVKGRLGILQVHTRKVPLALGVDLDVIARGTPGFSGADLENLVNEAALWAARKDKDKVEMGDFEAAKDKVLMGTERRSMIISDKEKRVTAYHEAGHALVARMLPGADPVHKVTIIPRGRALGVTQQLPAEDRLNMTREFARNQISILMGGRIAEEITFGEITTGAGNDIEVATDLARKMVCEWGMSEKLGPLAFGKKEEAIFLGREFAQHQDYSEETAIEIDQEVRRLVMENYGRAKMVITDNIDKLKAIAEALLEFETLSTEDINVLMNGDKIERKPPSPPAVPAKKDDARDREKKGFFPRPLGKEEPEPA
ncbi:MAG TPA: ATP-dependent zinc metalloprotease FtsH [Haliangiales bacterium]|nr:ATP-dependent zinc metalloprotease FtsH [Haliangiales bacterium]